MHSYPHTQLPTQTHTQCLAGTCNGLKRFLTSVGHSGGETNSSECLSSRQCFKKVLLKLTNCYGTSWTAWVTSETLPFLVVSVAITCGGSSGHFTVPLSGLWSSTASVQESVAGSSLPSLWFSLAPVSQRCLFVWLTHNGILVYRLSHWAANIHVLVPMKCISVNWRPQLL